MGRSCLLTARVSGCRRDPDPPARTIPFNISQAQTQAFAIVAARLDLFAPVAMLEIPADSLAQAGFEGVPRRPSQLTLDFRRVDRVAAIVTGTIGDERLE